LTHTSSAKTFTARQEIARNIAYPVIIPCGNGRGRRICIPWRLLGKGEQKGCDDAKNLLLAKIEILAFYT
jgi:hypothetical protein